LIKKVAKGEHFEPNGRNMKETKLLKVVEWKAE